MSDSIWSATLEQFRDRLAGIESVPAGVSTAAVSATFALGLLAKVLAIAAKRKDFAGDRALVDALLDASARTRRCIFRGCADSGHLSRTAKRIARSHRLLCHRCCAHSCIGDRTLRASQAASFTPWSRPTWAPLKSCSPRSRLRSTLTSP